MQMVGRCLTERLDKFPELVQFIVDLVEGYGTGLTILCAGYGKCDLLADSCDWKVMKAIAAKPDVVDSVHFYDPACPDTSGFRDAVDRDFGSVNGRVCETEDGLLDAYDFVMYFGAFENENFGLLEVYKDRTDLAFVHVRVPGWGMIGPDDIVSARKMYMQRHLDHPPEQARGGPLDPTLRDLAYEMQDRTFAFVELYRRENEFEREKYRFDRAETADDGAFRSYIGDEEYDRHAVQDGGARMRKGVVGALAMVTLFASLAMSAMA
jgi:hypothetical protein